MVLVSAVPQRGAALVSSTATPSRRAKADGVALDILKSRLGEP